MALLRNSVYKNESILAVFCFKDVREVVPLEIPEFQDKVMRAQDIKILFTTEDENFGGDPNKRPIFETEVPQIRFENAAAIVFKISA